MRSAAAATTSAATTAATAAAAAAATTTTATSTAARRLRATISAAEARLPAREADRLVRKLRQAHETHTPSTNAKQLRQAIYEERTRADGAAGEEAGSAAHDPLIARSFALPGLFASTRRVLDELRRLALPTPPASVLDMGQSWGAGVLAARATWPRHAEPTEEHEPGEQETNAVGSAVPTAAAGAARDTRYSLYDTSPWRARATAEWLGDVETLATLRALRRERTFDLVVAAHTLSERFVAPPQVKRYIAELWRRTGRFLVVIEPGTPEGYQNMLRVRDTVLRGVGGGAGAAATTATTTAANAEGEVLEERDSTVARVVAPCPHSGTCPMAQAHRRSRRRQGRQPEAQPQPQPQSSPFCHFSQRYERPEFWRQHLGLDRSGKMAMPSSHATSTRRFSYVVLERVPASLAPMDGNEDAVTAAVAAAAPVDNLRGRLVQPPTKRGRHVILTVCNADGSLTREVVAKSHGERGGYRAARHAEWGDTWHWPALGAVQSALAPT